jgi:hypothetical protein
MERTGIIGQEMPALPAVTKASSGELHYIPEYRVNLIPIGSSLIKTQLVP